MEKNVLIFFSRLKYVGVFGVFSWKTNTLLADRVQFTREIMDDVEPNALHFFFSLFRILTVDGKSVNFHQLIIWMYLKRWIECKSPGVYVACSDVLSDVCSVAKLNGLVGFPAAGSAIGIFELLVPWPGAGCDVTIPGPPPSISLKSSCKITKK